MKIRIICVAALAAALLAVTAPRSAQTNSAATPTFTKEVAPILYKHCASCHRPGDIAPMSLLTYENARPWAKSIREQVATGQMPPWHAAAPHGTFANDRRLSEQEKETLIRWASNGAPKGNPKDLPPPPVFPEGWEIGTPDAVISIPKEYEVPAEGTINYQYFEASTNFTEDKWVQAIEVRPGARPVVHHVLVFCREPGAPARQPAFTQVVPDLPAAARPQAQGAAPRREERSPGALIATTAPGTNAMIFRPGTALRIKAGSVLTFQMHYTANGSPTKDRSSVGMIFAKEPPQEEIRNSAFVNPIFAIPPGAANHAVETAIQFNEDAQIYALFPHTHLRGKSWEYRLIYPDGRSEVVLSVPKYDFNWQTYYVFTKPLAVPKGARLTTIAHYDNSVANPSNPDSKATVRWGEQTWEEMQYSGITFSVGK
jgi:mono/diheme cytochrome c family protein